MSTTTSSPSLPPLDHPIIIPSSQTTINTPIPITTTIPTPITNIIHTPSPTPTPTTTNTIIHTPSPTPTNTNTTSPSTNTSILSTTFNNSSPNTPNISTQYTNTFTPTTIPLDWRQKFFPFFYNPDFTNRQFYGNNTWEVAKPYVIGCGAAMYASFGAAPVLNIKTMYQVLDKKDHNVGRIRNLWSYLKTFGLFNLWRGFPTMFQGQFVSTFVHLNFIRNTHDQPTPLTYPEAIASSLLAVTFATMMYAPFDTIATRQQADVLLPSQLQYKYRSLYHAIINITKQETPLALLRGSMYSLTRNLAHTTTLFTFFPFLTSNFQQKNTAVESACYIALALTSALLFHPLDTMKTITQVTPSLKYQQYVLGGQFEQFSQQFMNNNNNNSGNNNLNNAFKPVRSHIKRNGILSLYRGLLPNMAVTVGVPIATYLIVDLVARSKIMK